MSDMKPRIAVLVRTVRDRFPRVDRASDHLSMFVESDAEGDDDDDLHQLLSSNALTCYIGLQPRRRRRRRTVS